MLLERKDYFFAHLFLGYVYYRTGRHRAAVSQFTKGIAQNDKYFDLYYYRAHANYRAGDRGAALADLNKADQLYPSNRKTQILRKRLIRSNRKW